MKKFIVYYFICISSFLYSQDIKKITLTSDGFSPSEVIINSDSLTKSIIYSNTLKWINKNYSNPDFVIKAKIDNEMIRFTGVSTIADVKNLMGKKFSIEAEYTIEVNIKDYKYKINILDFNSFGNVHKTIFNKKGELRTKEGIRIKEDIETFINNLISSLDDEILKKDNDTSW